jgi:hypothetical protein
MIGLAVVVQKFEQVGGEGWLSSHIGSILVAIAAISAAGLAAHVAIRNQRQQLAHDRHLRNQDHLRDTIDAAVASASDAVLALSMFLSNIQAVEIWRETSDEALGDAGALQEDRVAARKAEEKWLGELMAERDTCYPKLNVMRATNVRLELRLGGRHPIVSSHERTREALFTLMSEAIGGILAIRPKSVSDGDDDRLDAAGDAFSDFRSACSRWFSE